MRNASMNSTTVGLQIHKLHQDDDAYQGRWNQDSWLPPRKMTDEDGQLADEMSLEGSDDGSDSTVPVEPKIKCTCNSLELMGRL